MRINIISGLVKHFFSYFSYYIVINLVISYYLVIILVINLDIHHSKSFSSGKITVRAKAQVS